MVKYTAMNQRLSPATALLLAVPSFLWAGNAVVGRLVNSLIGPMTLNFLRWVLAFVILLPLAHRVLQPGSAMWTSWKRFASSQSVHSNIQRIVEAYKLKFEFLNSESQLDVKLTASARSNLYIILVRVIGKLFLKLKWREVVTLLRAFEIPLIYFIRPWKKPLKLDPFSEFTASNPYRLSFKENPFTVHQAE